jgi:hypothetical protein
MGHGIRWHEVMTSEFVTHAIHDSNRTFIEDLICVSKLSHSLHTQQKKQHTRDKLP